ncbi:polyphosphate kinase 1 [Chitinophaga caeni]|nr:polyphosphate kinase 1 [Chitinophaga caeni]
MNHFYQEGGDFRMPPSPDRYYDRDLSWLSFNALVLKMATRKDVPLFDRIRFLSIFSSNLDEFYRVRISALLAVVTIEDQAETAAKTLLGKIQDTIAQQQQLFGNTLRQDLLPALLENNIHLYYDEPVLPEHYEYVSAYFYNHVLGFLKPMWLEAANSANIFLENNQIYFAVKLINNDGQDIAKYAIVNIPTLELPRFQCLYSSGVTHIIWLDDIVRHHIGHLFPGFEVAACYSIKLTRNAEIDIEEFPGDLIMQVESLIVEREIGLPTRFLYDAEMPGHLLKVLANYCQVVPLEMVKGGHYHNLKDLADLPFPPDRPQAVYEKWPAVQVPAVQASPRLLDTLLEQDILIHPPYHSYDPVLRFFNEAATDPSVNEIYVTLYRVAHGSQIVQSLISAAKNGKQVTVLVELKARFDEANNIRWAKKMKAAGVKIIYSIPGLKVHAKIALIKRKHLFHNDYYALLATGNLNESTARFYTDHVLLTTNRGLTSELELLFIYLLTGEQPGIYQFIPFRELLVAQFNLVSSFEALIDREIQHVKSGKPGKMIIKLNNLQEQGMIDKLYEAAEAGVSVSLIVRSICCILPGYHENITIHRIVDRYLEHGRVFWWYNNGDEELYLGSADWMNRNLYNRIEVCFPIYGKEYKRQIKHMLDLQLSDNTNAVLLGNNLENIPVPKSDGTELVNAQSAMYDFVKQLY